MDYELPMPSQSSGSDPYTEMKFGTMHARLAAKNLNKNTVGAYDPVCV